jgi:cytochrome c oxidase subunit 2
MIRKNTYFAMALPALVALIGIGVAALLVRSDDGPANGRLTVDVFARQYAWAFGYPDAGDALSTELHVPLGGQVQFRLYSQDVLHSFWVPEWRIKEDSAPGVTGMATVTPHRVGTYQLICAERCGLEHGSMRAKVVVERPREFRTWLGGLDQTVPDRFLETIRINNELEAIREETEGDR